jgi:hypothetical protein
MIIASIFRKMKNFHKKREVVANFPFLVLGHNFIHFFHQFPLSLYRNRGSNVIVVYYILYVYPFVNFFVGEINILAPFYYISGSIRAG